MRSRCHGGRYRISIHAPAKGATYWTKFQVDSSVFQSTLPRRERQKDPRGFVRETDFNPRSREGSDDLATIYGVYKDNFNPRSREGSDGNPRCSRKAIDISIHAPAKGATQGGQQSFPYCLISIHAPAKGATSISSVSSVSSVLFQSTLPRRERRTAPTT